MRFAVNMVSGFEIYAYNQNLAVERSLKLKSNDSLKVEGKEPTFSHSYYQTHH
jgi:hypothetical protein